jgi:glycosyltransferase involved in cell wall biosynthesis
MNICIDGITYTRQAFGGVSRIFTQILPRLCDMDTDVHIRLMLSGQVLQVPPVHPRIERLVVPHFTMPRLKPGRLWQSVFAQNVQYRINKVLAARAISPYRDHIWHSTYYTLPHRWNGKIVVTFFDLVQELFPADFTNHFNDDIRRRKYELAHAADRIICISETTRQDVLKVYPDVDPARVVAIPLAYDHAVFRHMPDAAYPPPDKPYLLYVGTRARHKNFDTLITAYTDWELRHAIDLVVVGRPWRPDEELKYGSIPGLRHVGHITDAELVQHYHQAAAFVYPSRYEGFGIPLVEAMACGCPIIASAIPTSHEVAGDVPWYFDVDDAAALRSALSQAVQAGRQVDNVQAGLIHAPRYTWDETARQTLAVYRTLLNS